MNEAQYSEDRGAQPGYSQPRNPEVAYEHRDLDLRAIVKFAIALVIFTFAGFIYLWGLLNYFQTNTAKSEPKPPALASERRQLPPEPRLQGAPGHEESPAAELLKFREQEDQELHSYGWIDRKAGVVRIPIDEAKSKLLKRGLPTRQEIPTTGSTEQGSSLIATKGIQPRSSQEGAPSHSANWNLQQGKQR